MTSMRIGFVAWIITFISVVTSAFGDWTFHDGDTREDTLGSEDYPSARAYTANCQFHDRDLFVMFGGYGMGELDDLYYAGGYLSDLWFQNTTTLTWSRSPNPSNPVQIDFKGRYYGQGYNESNWPVSRYDAKLFCLEKEDKIVLHGGINEEAAGRSNRPYSDVWEYSLTLHQWKRISEEDINDGIIYYLRDFSAAYYQPDQAIIVVGGNWRESNRNKTDYTLSRNAWNFKLNSSEWSIVNREVRDSDPISVINCASVLIPPTKFYVFGGLDEFFNVFNSMYSYDIVKKTWNKESSDLSIRNDLGFVGPRFHFSNSFFPRARYYAATDYDPLKSCIIIFGGIYDYSIYPLSDLWLFDVTTAKWAYFGGPIEAGQSSRFGVKGNASSAIFPGGRFAPAVYFNRKTSQFVLFGGTIDYYNPRINNELWSFDLKKPIASTAITGKTSTSIYTGTETPDLRDTRFSLTINPLRDFGSEGGNSASQYYILYIIVISAILALILIAYTVYKCHTSPKYSTDGRNVLGSMEMDEKSSITTKAEFTTMFTSLKEEITYVSSDDALSLPAYKECSVHDFALTKQLNMTAGSTVYLAEFFFAQNNSPRRSEKIVVKMASSFNESVPLAKKKAFVQEVSIMQLLSRSGRTVEVLAYCINPLAILMHFYTLGNLQQYLQRVPFSFDKNPVTDTALIHDIALGLQEIHSFDIVHCDIKCVNIFLEKSQTDNARLKCVIGDFGVSQITSTKPLGVRAFDVSDARGISISYAAPELFTMMRTKLFTITMKSRDIYALAVVINEVLTRVDAWKINFRNVNK